jgi:ubiquinol-cytochrome c reductase, iron-sulfur subunit
VDADATDRRRRRFLKSATSAVGIVGAGIAIWPFIRSLAPNAAARAAGAPVRVDISKLAPGQQITVVWRLQPVWVLYRTPAMLDSLKQTTPRLADPDSREPQQPDYCEGIYRAIKPEYLVLVGLCTHLGCSPELRVADTDPNIDSNWLGGYLCPCHGSRYDLSGRVFRAQPAPLNMLVPPYRYDGDQVVVIGEDPSGNAAA